MSRRNAANSERTAPPCTCTRNDATGWPSTRIGTDSRSAASRADGASAPRA